MMTTLQPALQMMTAPLHYLARRANWQLQANQDGALTEGDTKKVIQSYLDMVYPGEYKVVSHPGWFGQPYLEMDYDRNPSAYKKPETPVDKDEWFDEDRKLFMRQKGKGVEVIKETFVPDTGITHIASGRRYVIECKRQNAAGNAHERACKYASSSMIDFMKKKLDVDYHPVGYLFAGGIASDKSYVREIKGFFGFAGTHLLFWTEDRKPEILTNWLESNVLPLLKGSSQSE